MMQNFSDAVYFLNYGTLKNIKTSGVTEYRGPGLSWAAIKDGGRARDFNPNISVTRWRIFVFVV